MPKSHHHRPGPRPAARPTEEIIFQSALKVNMDEIRQEQALMIAEHGFFIQEVFAERDGSLPSFAYTVGLCKGYLPEVICIGLSPEVSAPLLNAVAKQLMAAPGVPPKDGDLVEEVANLPLKLMELDPDVGGDIAFGALDYADRMDLPLEFFQLVYPDRDGRFPDQEGCDPVIKEIQNPGRFSHDPEDGGGD